MKKTFEFDKKLAGYALAGTAVLALPMAGYATVANPTVSVTGSGSDSFNVDINQDGIFDFTLNAGILSNSNTPGYTEYYGLIWASGLNDTNFIDTSSNPPLSYPTAFGSAAAVTPGGISSTSGKLLKAAPAKGNWPNGGDAWLGLTFSADGQEYLGWADIQTSAGSVSIQQLTPGQLQNSDSGTAFATATILSTGYTAATPEPSSIALLALGAAGLLAVRKRRAQLN